MRHILRKPGFRGVHTGKSNQPVNYRSWLEAWLFMPRVAMCMDREKLRFDLI